METDFRSAEAIVFPGMGPSRFEDVAKFMMINPFARKLVAVADEALGYSLLDRYRETEGDYSEYAQVAFLVNCLALGQWAEEAFGIEPDVCAGPSFGGKAAAVYSGALSIPDAVWLTAQLARCMDEYFAEEFRDVVTLSFTRTPERQLREALQDLDEQEEWYDISCYIDDDFYMVSLRENQLDGLEKRLRAAGGLPLYTMRPPMHASAFSPLRDKAEREAVSRVQFTDPVLPVIADQDGTLLSTADGVRTMLLDGFVRPVRWPEVVAALKRLGVGKVHISGQDSLFGRVGCTTRNFDVAPINPRIALQPRRRIAAATP